MFWRNMNLQKQFKKHVSIKVKYIHLLARYCVEINYRDVLVLYQTGSSDGISDGYLGLDLEKNTERECRRGLEN